MSTIDTSREGIEKLIARLSAHYVCSDQGADYWEARGVVNATLTAMLEEREWLKQTRDGFEFRMNTALNDCAAMAIDRDDLRARLAELQKDHEGCCNDLQRTSDHCGEQHKQLTAAQARVAELEKPCGWPDCNPAKDSLAREERLREELTAAQAQLDKLEAQLYSIGVCARCGEELVHSVDEPFSDCKCGTSEDTSGPSVLQRLRTSEAKLREELTSVAAVFGAKPNPIQRDHHRWIVPGVRSDGGDLHVDLVTWVSRFVKTGPT